MGQDPGETPEGGSQDGQPMLEGGEGEGQWVMDSNSKAMRKSQGLCEFHWSSWLEVLSALGVCGMINSAAHSLIGGMARATLPLNPQGMAMGTTSHPLPHIHLGKSLH